jgi:hypothetical protein
MYATRAIVVSSKIDFGRRRWGHGRKVRLLSTKEQTTMTALAKLKFVNFQADRRSPIIQRRAKLTGKVAEQIALAKAQASGEVFAATRKKLIADPETGARRAVDSSVRVKPWWWAGDNGAIVLAVRYGSKVLEIVKGKNAIDVGSAQDLVPTLEAVRDAVVAGELDAAIEQASGALRAGFGKKKK